MQRERSSVQRDREAAVERHSGPDPVSSQQHRPAVNVPVAGPLSRSLLDQLQRTVGNQAAARLLSGTGRQARPVPIAQQGPVVQRDLTEDQKKSWAEHDGPKIIQGLKVATDKWKAFRQSPDSYDNIPKAGQAPSQLAELLQTGERAYAQYAAEQLGPEAVKQLGEMAGFMPECRLLVGVVPGVAWVDPAHKYILKSAPDGVGSVLNKVPMIPVGSYTIEYSNAYGWTWTKELTGSQAQWKVGLSYERGRGPGGGGTGDSGEGRKGGENIGRGLIPMPATISINSQATGTSVAYWGYKDVAGLIQTANGPSVKGTYRGFGVKTATGGIITIRGSGGRPPGELTFMNIAHEVSLEPKPTGPLRPSDLKSDAAVSLTLVDTGVGVLVGGGQTVSIPVLKPRPVPEHKEWNYVLAGFETGDPNLPIPPGEIHPIMNLIKSDLADKQKNVDSIKPMLKEAGIEQDFNLFFTCEGFASRRWAGVHRDADRQQRNLDLSRQRAENVAAALGDTFGPKHQYSGVGKGGAILMAGGRFGEAVAEADPAVVEAKVKEREERIRSRNRNDFTEEQIGQMVKEYRESLLRVNSPDSDVAMARRVNITVTWDGYNIQFGAGSPSEPTSRP